jgi:hypothetical protein
LPGALLALTLTVLACAAPGPGPSPPSPPPVATVAQGKPVPAVQLALRFRPERLQLGDEVALELTLSALADVARVRVALRLPPEVRLVAGPSDWEGALAAGARRVLTFPVRLAGAGRFDVGASAEVMEGPYAGQVSGAAVYVDATPGAVRWSSDPL